MTEKKLSELVHLDSGTLSALLRRLEKQGYINRKRTESDERMLYLSLTDKGDKLRHDAAAVPSSIPNCLGLSSDELKNLKALLDKAVKNMSEKGVPIIAKVDGVGTPEDMEKIKAELEKM